MSIGELVANAVEALKRRVFGPSLIFEVTPRCNLACRFCYNVWKARDDYPTGELSTVETFDMLATLIGETCSRHLTFTGGEPLLRDDLEEIAAFLHAKGVAMTCVTNGTLLSPARVEGLIAAGLKNFEVPVLAIDSVVHDELAGAPAFSAMIDGVANVRLAGGRVAGTFVATARNIDQWPAVIELALALGLDGLSFNRFNPGGEGARHQDELMLPSRAVFIEALELADQAVARHGLTVDVPIPTPPCVVTAERFEHLQFVGCAAGTDNAYWTLDSLGNLRPCNHSPTILGNVRRQSFKEIVANEKTGQWVSTMPEPCQACRWREPCCGSCRASAEVCYGTTTKLDPFVEKMRGQ